MTSSRAAFVLIAALCAGGVAAQEKTNVEDLKMRSTAGDKAATRQLADMYYLGRGGVAQNLSEAARWYEMLAKQGDARAQASLGLMYARGYGVAKDMDAARQWWSFAAAQNDPGAQYNLGLLYSKGDGVSQDYPQGAQWLARAAQRGHIQAQHNLGMLYYEGKGVERNPLRAYYWIKVAALQGDEAARAALNAVGKGMSDEQIRQAETQAGEWMKRMEKVVGH